MELCGRCGEVVGEIPEVIWWCWWCGRALCVGCGGSDTATCGVVPRTCDASPRRALLARAGAVTSPRRAERRAQAAPPSYRTGGS